MKKRLPEGLLFVLLSSFLMSATAVAEPATSSYRWNGFYLGASAGKLDSQAEAKTATQPGPLLDPIQAEAVNNAGHQNINLDGFITGIQGGYNWQRGWALIGLEADIQALSANGETDSGAIFYPNNTTAQFVLNSYANHNWLLTARPRIGLVSNNWLFYLTGGLALGWVQGDFVFSDNLGNFESKRARKLKAGYDLGAGIETGLSNHISLKAEYLFVHFSDLNASDMNNNVPAGQTFSNSVNMQSNIVRVGINYHFNDAISGPINLQLPDIWKTSQWQVEMGARLFTGSGLDGSPQPLLGWPNTPLISRLIFSDLTALSGETFARFDHSSGFFAKGYLGAGSIIDGQLNDEDFPGDEAYSNTHSSALGNLSYATLDLGYSLFKTPTAKAGFFVGYNYYAQNINVYGCEQLAGSMVCVPSSELDNFIGITQDDYYKSIRLGFSTQFNLTDYLTLTSEAAYLPFVNYAGTDIHNARQLVGPEASNNGDGAMLETILNYQLSPSWSLGVGGRYWMWNMRTGSVTFDFLGDPDLFNQPARFNSERYGVFLQLSYREAKSNMHPYENGPVSWEGIYIGGQLGGGWGESHWSDPFSATLVSGSLANVAGFGDQIKSTGPLGGLNLNLNWQNHQWVYGLSGTMSTANIRGENTLYSGLGGINGQTITGFLGTVVGRLGVASDASLFYVNVGRALLSVNYNVNANTGVLTLGSESKTEDAWGWTGGVGVEYALSNHWTTNVEYDYIYIRSRTLSFPSIDVLNSNRLSANQSMNVFKVGLNYKIR